jgi:hypothetical protein
MSKELYCYGCGHVWMYKGKNPRKTSCGRCGGHVYFKKSQRVFDENGINFFDELTKKYYDGELEKID